MIIVSNGLLILLASAHAVSIPVHVDITSVEHDCGVIWIELNSFIEVRLRVIKLVDMVIGETSVVIVDCRILVVVDCLGVVSKCLLELSFFEVRETQVVVHTWSVIFHLDCFFKFLD